MSRKKNRLEREARQKAARAERANEKAVTQSAIDEKLAQWAALNDRCANHRKIDEEFPLFEELMAMASADPELKSAMAHYKASGPVKDDPPPYIGCTGDLRELAEKRGLVRQPEAPFEFSESFIHELISSFAFKKQPPPFLVVELPVPGIDEKTLPADARLDLSSGPVWVFPYQDRNNFVSLLDGDYDDFIDRSFASGFDSIVAVFRGVRFMLLPVKSRLVGANRPTPKPETSKRPVNIQDLTKAWVAKSNDPNATPEEREQAKRLVEQYGIGDTALLQ